MNLIVRKYTRIIDKLFVISFLILACSSNNDKLIADKLEEVNDLNYEYLIRLHGAIYSESRKEINNSKRHFIDSVVNNVNKVISKLDSSQTVIYKFNRAESLDILSKSWMRDLKNYTQHKFSLDSIYSNYPLSVGKELLRQDMIIYSKYCLENFAEQIDVEDE